MDVDIDIAAGKFRKRTTDLFTLAVAAGSDQERLTALHQLLKHLTKANVHPIDVQIKLPLDEEDEDDYELISEELASRLDALEEQYASLQAENNRLARQRAIAIKEAEHRVALAERQHHASLAAAHTAREAALARAEKFRQALSDRVARSKKRRSMPLNEAALDLWQRLQKAADGFGRKYRSVVAAITGVPAKELNRYAELREPLPLMVVERVEAYVAARGYEIPTSFYPKPATRTASRAPQACARVGVFTAAEVTLLGACELEPSVVEARLKHARRIASDLDRRLVFILAEVYGVSDVRGVCSLLGIYHDATLLVRKPDWITRLSELARVPIERLKDALRARKVSLEWLKLLPDAVAA